MEDVIDALSAILAETRFDFEYRQHAQQSSDFGSRRGTLRDGSASMLRELYEQEVEGRNLRVSIRQDAPDALMARLLDVLRDEFKRFIDPETDRIGHTFPIEGGSAHYFARGDQGLVRWEYYSELQGFARALVQAAAVTGVQSVVARLVGWCQGEPLEVRIATVLSGLILSDTVALEGDVELVPLGLSTAELPRLPMLWGDKASDYLGLTLLRLGLSTSPVLFQPSNDENGRPCRSRSAHGVDGDPKAPKSGEHKIWGLTFWIAVFSQSRPLTAGSLLPAMKASCVRGLRRVTRRAGAQRRSRRAA